ncbi:hypothetical protein [Candidatus Amarolinea dominans]|uniref:hypothetical protein n=1 Tax=Candidatus Amarolinea dominans TaxID=3140696 RepID=UPI001D20949D|nr:hypothetical protein [Anaerolineae bacterium]
MSLSISQTVAEVLRLAERALTLTEILARVRLLRPVDTAKPEVTIRNTLGSLPLAISLGGRPAHYVWWPHSLAANCFRQPLTDLDLASGQVILHEEDLLAFWPTFFADVLARPHEVTLVAGDGFTIPAQIDHLRLARLGFPTKPYVGGLAPPAERHNRRRPDRARARRDRTTLCHRTGASGHTR